MEADAAATSRWAGRIGPVPYDFTIPTPQKIAQRFWEPSDPRLFRAHAFGIGWAPNLGALAVRLGTIEPDAEDVPFACTSDRAFVAAAALPVAVAAATVLHYAVRPTPDRLPTHWSWRGVPDRWAGGRTVAARHLVTALAAAGVSAWAAGTSTASGRARAGAAAMAAGASAYIAGEVVTSARGDEPTAWAGPALLGAITAATGATLWGLARSGRAHEIRRDTTRRP